MQYEQQLTELVLADVWFMAVLRAARACDPPWIIGAELFQMILRRNPARVSLKEFQRRYVSKRIHERSPHVQIIENNRGRHYADTEHSSKTRFRSDLSRSRPDYHWAMLMRFSGWVSLGCALP